jgi:DNA-binding CsgD family transcriptional regulator
MLSGSWQTARSTVRADWHWTTGKSVNPADDAVPVDRSSARGEEENATAGWPNRSTPEGAEQTVSEHTGPQNTVLEFVASRAQTIALDQLNIGILVFNHDGRFIYANKAGAALSARMGLRLAKVFFEFPDGARPENERLRRTLAHTLSFGTAGSLLIGAETRDPVAMSMTRILDRAHGQTTRSSNPPHCFVLVTISLIMQTRTSPDVLSDLFGLTASEAAVAQDLAAGLPVKSVAAKRDVSIFTIRAQIRQILFKTGCKNLQSLAWTLSRVL